MSDIHWNQHRITKQDRAVQNGQTPCVLWFTGLSGSGKSTIAGAVEEWLFAVGRRTYLLDGDNVRHGLNSDLGFSDADRTENIRRIGELSKLFVDAGFIAIAAFISPFEEDRNIARDLVEAGEFVEIYMSAPLRTCEAREQKGLYQKARQGKLKNFTGIDSVYEMPKNPQIILDVTFLSVEECLCQVVSYLRGNRFI